MYAGIYKTPNSLRSQQVYTAIAGQTLFSNLNYNPAVVDIFVNGEKKVAITDYVAADGLSITFTSPLSLGDKVEILSNDEILAPQVTSVNGQSGNVVLAVQHISGAAPIDSPLFTGTPHCPTPNLSSNSTEIVTAEFVTAQGYLTTATAQSDFAYKTGSNAVGDWPVNITGSATSLYSTNSYRIKSLGVGVNASSTEGTILATNDIIAFFSDKRLKDIKGTIPNALSKVESLNGIIYTNNQLANDFGYTDTEEKVGLIAQEVEAILPQLVTIAPFDREEKDGKVVSKSGNDYKTVQYDKIVALLVEAVKELSARVKELEGR